jgi:23S rRNA (adenine2503-C2)-methyltransferase
MSRDHLRRHVLGHGLPGFRAEQMFSWVYQKRVRDPIDMTNLPLSFRHSLPAICDFALPETASVHKSPDGNTHKFVLRLADGARVESARRGGSRSASRARSAARSSARSAPPA